MSTYLFLFFSFIFFLLLFNNIKLKEHYTSLPYHHNKEQKEIYTEVSNMEKNINKKLNNIVNYKINPKKEKFILFNPYPPTNHLESVFNELLEIYNNSQNEYNFTLINIDDQKMEYNNNFFKYTLMGFVFDKQKSFGVNIYVILLKDRKFNTLKVIESRLSTPNKLFSDNLLLETYWREFSEFIPR